MNKNIIIIDNQRYFIDSDNDCLVPLDDYDSESWSKTNQLDKINYNNKTESKFDSNYLDYSLKKFEEITMTNNRNSNSINDQKSENSEKLENLDNLNEWYMENYDIDFWENILSRNLERYEKKLIHGVWNENSLNIDVQVLQKNLIKQHCYIKSITNNVGNCLFESLASLGLGDNDLGISTHSMIRKSLATVLLMVKTEIGFFPKIDLTPEELFKNINDIEFVKDKKTGVIYEYDYDMMIYDLNSSFSWERLPTEFILMTVSRIYDVEIKIYHNKSDYVNIINVLENPPNDIIRLGQINEEHYFPILEIPNDLKNDQDVINEILNTKVIYNRCINEFKKWSKTMMDSIGLNNNFETNHNTDVQDSLINKSNKIIDDSNSIKIMKSNNKLTIEQIEDYKEISNFDDFDIL